MANKLYRLVCPNPSAPQVELLCNGIIAGNELSLTFVSRTMWVDVLNNLELTYRRTEEF